MAKIHLLGGPGSGKTTLAHQLSSMLIVPHYDLDTFGRKYGDRMAAYVDEAFAIAAQPEWITEGIYLMWTDPLLHQADVIVVLRVTWPIAAWRIIRRHVANILRGTNQYPGIKPLFYLLRGARSYYLNKHRAQPPTATLARTYLEERNERAGSPTVATILKDVETYKDIVIPPTAAFVREYVAQYGEKVVFVKNNADQQRLLERIGSLQA